MSLRRSIFWIHLVCGVVSGVVIAIMSVTGIAIAFEEEILAWYDRDVSRITAPAAGASVLTIQDVRDRVEAARPGFSVTRLTVPRDPSLAYMAYSGREGPLYVDPYTGALNDSRAHGVHDLIHTLEEWHRWLGADDGVESFGRLVTGVCNVAFLVLCVTGLYLWWPRRWTRAVLRRSVWIVPAQSAKARDFNWHNVVGLWSLPVLIVLAGTAVVISFGWAHRLVFTVFGEEAPKARNYGMMAVPAARVPTPPAGSQPLPLDEVLARVGRNLEDWQTISIEIPVTAPAEGEAVAPLNIGVTVRDYMPSRAYVPVEADPFTGEILQAIRFEDRSPGLQARVWIRFLHTGAGLGLPGKIIATIATAASLILVYTGFALAWRRLLRAGRNSAAPAN